MFDVAGVVNWFVTIGLSYTLQIFVCIGLIVDIYCSFGIWLLLTFWVDFTSYCCLGVYCLITFVGLILLSVYLTLVVVLMFSAGVLYVACFCVWFSGFVIWFSRLLGVDDYLECCFFICVIWFVCDLGVWFSVCFMFSCGFDCVWLFRLL